MEDLIQLSYAVDTFYFLVMGALVMFMAPGFAMLEAGYGAKQKHIRNSDKERRAVRDFLCHVFTHWLRDYVWR